MSREITLPGIEGTYITDYGTNQSSDLENFYLVLYEAYHSGETFTPSSEEILNYIRTHFNDSDNFVQGLGKIQEGYGDPLITMIIEVNNCDLPIKIYEIVKDKPRLVDKLFNVSKNHDHPLEKVYRECGINEMFELIDRAYNRRFDILTEINDYLDPSSAFDALMRRKRLG